MNVNFKIAQHLNRERAKREGFYDGRFRSKVMPDKKKGTYLKLRKEKINKLSF